jgi:drug/metabolite transporter (DMT)-like permease
VKAVEEVRQVTVSGPTVESPNWVLVLVCVVVSLTALWEAVGAGRSGSWLDLAGYVALALSGVLFAVQAALTPRRPDTGERLQAPAVFLTIVGIFLLLISPSPGPRL